MIKLIHRICRSLYAFISAHMYSFLVRGLPVMIFSALGTVLIFAGVQPIFAILTFGCINDEVPPARSVLAQSDEDALRAQIELAMKRRAEEAQLVTLRYEQIENLKSRTRPRLVAAALACNLSESKLIVAEGVDINAPDTRGETALIAAVKRGCPSVAEYLVRAGADPYQKAENGYSALDWARFFGRERVERLLIAQRTD